MAGTNLSLNLNNFGLFCRVIDWNCLVNVRFFSYWIIRNAYLYSESGQISVFQRHAIVELVMMSRTRLFSILEWPDFRNVIYFLVFAHFILHATRSCASVGGKRISDHQRTHVNGLHWSAETFSSVFFGRRNYLFDCEYKRNCTKIRMPFSTQKFSSN